MPLPRPLNDGDKHPATLLNSALEIYHDMEAIEAAQFGYDGASCAWILSATTLYQAPIMIIYLAALIAAIWTQI